MGDFFRVVRRWWGGALVLLLGVISAAALGWDALLAALVAAVLILIVVGSVYRADQRNYTQPDEPSSPGKARFTIKAATPYSGIPAGINSLIIPDVSVVNWSEHPLELRFTLLAAGESAPLDKVATSLQPESTGSQVLANPMHLDPHSSRSGRLIWVHGGGDVTPYLVAGVRLRVIEAPTGDPIDIPLPTTGYHVHTR